MKKVDALFVGLNTVDLQFFVNTYPEVNTKTKAHRNEIAAGGPATNAAIICSKLGGFTSLITPIGKHSLTRFISDDITNHGVKLIDPIENIESKPVFASIITEEINGDRTVFSYHPERDYIDLLEELKLPDLDRTNIALFDGFYPDLAISLAKYLKARGITTVLDGGSWKPGLDELLPYIDIAICSNDFKAPGTHTGQELFTYLKTKGCKYIAITRGHESILYSENDQISEIDVTAIEVVDTLGAGDFFHGAFCYFYGMENNFEKALADAAQIAGFSCRFHGTRSWFSELDELKSLTLKVN